MTDLIDIYNTILKDKTIGFDAAKKLCQYYPKTGLYALADDVRKHFMGDLFDMCSIINARSGRCNENCKWCAQSAFHNTEIEEYELLEPHLAIYKAIQNEKAGINKYSLVTSGKRVSKKNLDKLCRIYKNIKKQSGITLCGSFGLIDKEDMEKLKAAGIKHYHCNLETAPSFFHELCTTHTYGEKIRTIRWAQEAGLEVCSGGIIGMGETMEHRIELAIELHKLGIKSIPVNILMPVSGTPMENQAPLDSDEILTTIALFRLINPEAYIRFAGGRKFITDIQDKALKAGINAALVGDLLTTCGTKVEDDIRSFRNAGYKV